MATLKVMEQSTLPMATSMWVSSRSISCMEQECGSVPRNSSNDKVNTRMESVLVGCSLLNPTLMFPKVSPVEIFP